MVRHFFKLWFRQLIRHKRHSLIHIASLVTGMSCSCLVLLWVANEVSFDSFHKNVESIYRLKSNMVPQPLDLAQTLLDNYPEVVDAVRFYRASVLVRYGDQCYDEENFFFTDPSAFRMFTFPSIQGDLEETLKSPNSVIITKDMAAKYFGSENPIGRVLRLDNRADLMVAGVVQNTPVNSTIQFDFLGSLSFLEPQLDASWSNHQVSTFIRLDDGVQEDELMRKASDIVMKRSPIVHTPLSLTPLRRIHLFEEGSIIYVRIFSMIAVFVLLVAWFNSVMITTARSQNRIKEIGIKKVVGVGRASLIGQIFTESIFFSLISGLLSILLVIAVLPLINAMLETKLTLDWILRPGLILGWVGIVLATSLAAGAYPALFLSSFRPVLLMHESRLTGGSRKGIFWKAMVLMQFSISIGLIIGTLTVSRQMNYIHDLDLGFNREHLVTMRIRGGLQYNSEGFKQEMKDHPGILDVTLASSLPSFVDNTASGFSWEGMNPDQPLYWQFVAADEDYLKTLRLTLKEGRNFSRDVPGDQLGVIVNEKAAAVMGFDSPIGKRFSIWGFDGSIVGVVKDFHFRPVYTEIQPLMIWQSAYFYEYILIRIDPSAPVGQTLDRIREVWQRHIPDFPFEYRFLDEAYEQNYRNEQRSFELFKYFAGLAILISCLGLLGVTDLAVEKRTKEIGIRKVLGASIPNILLLLSREYLILVTAANAVAWPLAYILMAKWLDHFAYKAHFGITVFVLSACAALAIAGLTVLYNATRAAFSNATQSLRHE